MVEDIYHFGFDKELNRELTKSDSPVVYDMIQDQIMPVLMSGGLIDAGSAGQVVLKNVSVGTTNIQYTITTGGIVNFGDGSDGDVTLTTNTTLTTDKYYDTLTINPLVTLSPAGYRIFCRTACYNYGSILINGNAGGAGGNGSAATAGTGGTAGASLADGYLKGSLAGKAGGAGGAGGDASPGSAGTDGTIGSNTSNSIGSNGVAGGDGGMGRLSSGGSTTNFGAGKAGGTVTASNVKLIANWHLATLLDIGSTGTPIKFDNSASSGSAGGGGGGGGSGSPNGIGGGGGGGGGSGSCGGILALYAKILINQAGSVISANGGAGGAGGNGGNATGTNGNASGGGGGGGGGGGNGGQVILIYNTYTNNGTVTSNGGTGGAAGLASTVNLGTGATGNNGVAGINGTTSIIKQFQVSL